MTRASGRPVHLAIGFVIGLATMLVLQITVSWLVP